MKYISNRLSCLSPLVLVTSLPRAFCFDVVVVDADVGGAPIVATDETSNVEVNANVAWGVGSSEDSDAWICESSDGETCDYGRNPVKVWDGRVFCNKGDDPLAYDGAHIGHIPIGWFMDKCDAFVSSVCYFKYAESAVYDCAGFSIQVKLLESYGANITNNHDGLDDMDIICANANTNSLGWYPSGKDWDRTIVNGVSLDDLERCDKSWLSPINAAADKYTKRLVLFVVGFGASIAALAVTGIVCFTYKGKPAAS